MTLQFDEKTHTYWYFGEKVPSVTQLMKPLTRKIYDFIDKDILANAARRGTEVHKIIEDDLQNRLVDFSNYETDTIPYYQAFRSWKQNFFGGAVEIEGCEQKFAQAWRKNQYYAGTVDLIGKDYIIDFKTRTPNVRMDMVQLFLYAQAFPDKEKVYVVGLAKDGRYKQRAIHNIIAKNREHLEALVGALFDVQYSEKQANQMLTELETK